MTDNLRHWEALGKTDPKHTKPFQRAGGFRGTATKPIWIEYRLTEHFGPCGEGWGTEQPIFTLVPAGDEILVFCSLQCWYAENGAPKFVWGIGGDKVLVKQQSGLRADDEAYKKAFTDALGNAFKHVGSNADVHMGLFDDSKYVAEMRKEFAEESPAAPQHQERNATNGAGAGAAGEPLTPIEAAAHPTERERKVLAAREARKRITEALGVARTPAIIDEVIERNSAALEEIKDLHTPSYEAIMALAGRLKTEILASTG
jgi:hypothetical protein